MRGAKKRGEVYIIIKNLFRRWTEIRGFEVVGGSFPAGVKQGIWQCKSQREVV